MPHHRSTSPALTRRDAAAIARAGLPPGRTRSMMGAMRFFQRGIAMTIVGFAIAMSLSYVIPNAQAVEPTAPEAQIARAGKPQIVGLVTSALTVPEITRDAYGATAAPPPPPPPPPPVVSAARGKSVFSANLTPSSSSAALQYPVAPGTRVVSAFGPRSCSGCSSNHQGTDFGAPGGSPIWAVADGVVIETNAPGYTALGVHVRIQHVVNGEMFTSVYAHMITGSMPFRVGDTVRAGQVVGAVGCTGTCTGNHLHFEIHPGGGAGVDPMAWFAARIG